MPKRSDSELLTDLRDQLRTGGVTLALDLARLDKTDSPVSVQAESTRWLYGLIGLGAAATGWQGLPGGLVACIVGVSVWYAWVRPDVGRRIRARVDTHALHDVGLWRRLWRFGGVQLRAGAGVECMAPAGNWMQFVRDVAAKSEE